MDRVSVVVPVRDLNWRPELPGGAFEVILQSGVGITHARNAGARRARGEILLHSDDDVVIRGDLRWFHYRPDSEQWWVAQRWSTDTRDPYTAQVCAFLTAMAGLRVLSGSCGSFQAVRRQTFLDVGGYDERKVHEDHELARRLYDVCGPPAVAPFEVLIRRRTKKVGEVWEMMRRQPPVSNGPYLRLLPTGTSPGPRPT